MNVREREQVKLIASYELSSAVRGLDRRIRAIYADHGAKGWLHSGATIKAGVSAIQADGETFLRTIVDQIRAVSRGHSALKILTDAVRDYLKAAADQLPELVRMASGRIDQPNDSIKQAAQGLFDQACADIEAQTRLATYDFGDASGPIAPPTQSAPTLRKGGRPRSDFWDDMWAAIATALYDGALKPKTQADVERAMADWLDSNHHSAAPSTIRARARRLWDGIAALDD